MSKPQLTGTVKAGAKTLRTLLKKYDIVLTEQGFEYKGETPESKALTDDQKAELERFMEWWYAMFEMAAGPETEDVFSS